MKSIVYTDRILPMSWNTSLLGLLDVFSKISLVKLQPLETIFNELRIYVLPKGGILPCINHFLPLLVEPLHDEMMEVGTRVLNTRVMTRFMSLTSKRVHNWSIKYAVRIASMERSIFEIKLLNQHSITFPRCTFPRFLLRRIIVRTGQSPIHPHNPRQTARIQSKVSELLR